MKSSEAIFKKAEIAVENLEVLLSAPLKPFERTPSEGNVAGIYIFYEGGAPVYVGRTRKLAQRFRAHVTPNHNSASYAVKRLRQRHDLRPTYKQGIGSRSWIVENYRDDFLEEIAAIKNMDYRFLKVPDNIDQYFLEYLAEEELGLDHDGLDTS